MNIIIKNKKVGEITNDRIWRHRINNYNQLYRKFGNVSCFDAWHWDLYKFKVDKIEVLLYNGNKMSITKEDFEKNKEVVEYGNHGKQYAVDRKYWTIELADISAKPKPVALMGLFDVKAR